MQQTGLFCEPKEVVKGVEKLFSTLLTEAPIQSVDEIECRVSCDQLKGDGLFRLAHYQ
jgi:hypothetical protein